MSELVEQTLDYASVLEALPQPIAICDFDGEVLFLNAMGKHFLGLEKGDPFPRFGLNRRDTFSKVRIEVTGPLREYFLADVAISGAKRSFASMSISTLDADRYRVILEDGPPPRVTPILDEIDALVAVCDQRREIKLANASLSELLSSKGEPITSDVLSLFAEKDQDLLRMAAAEALAGGTPRDFLALLHEDLSQGEGEVRVRLRPTRGEEEVSGVARPRGFVLVVQPTTASFLELKRRTERAEVLMSLGELATGIAHELKNPLTSILNYADYLMEKYTGKFLDHRDEERLQKIIEGVERIDQFVQDLLLLARPEALEMEQFDFQLLIDTCRELSSRVLQEYKTEIDVVMDFENSQIRGNRPALRQVFTNLFLNAAMAMPEGGGKILLTIEKRNGIAEISVRDTGKGMTPEVAGRVFEPFFSTRQSGEGAGLGLALVRHIIEEHSGTIKVESAPGEGTTFTIHLPD